MAGLKGRGARCILGVVVRAARGGKKKKKEGGALAHCRSSLRVPEVRPEPGRAGLGALGLAWCLRRLGIRTAMCRRGHGYDTRSPSLSEDPAPIVGNRCVCPLRRALRVPSRGKRTPSLPAERPVTLGDQATQFMPLEHPDTSFLFRGSLCSLQPRSLRSPSLLTCWVRTPRPS